MDIIESILGIAVKLYKLCEEVKDNKNSCKRLADRVAALTIVVKKVKIPDLGEGVLVGLKALKSTLEEAQMVIDKCTSSKSWKQSMDVFKHRKDFKNLNEHLNESAQLLILALQVEQREDINRVFDKERRMREDDEDMKYDLQKLQASLKLAITEYEEMKKYIYDIKDTLNMLGNPSIYQLDITEIEKRKLTYGQELIMASSDYDMFKGEYDTSTVAIKRYKCQVNVNAREIRRIFNKEVETMKHFESPHILRMFGICIVDEGGPNPNYLIVMEYCEMGSLRQVLDRDTKLTWDIKICMCLDAAQGLYRLHESKAKFKVHGSITSSKFLVAAGNKVKLGGFELAQTETSLKKNKKKSRSSTIYCCPTHLEDVNHEYELPCEIYSFGIVMWEIATQRVPFKDCPSYDDLRKKVCEEKTMDPLPDDCPSHLRELIKACCSYESDFRPTARVLVDKLRKLRELYEE